MFQLGSDCFVHRGVHVHHTSRRTSQFNSDTQTIKMEATVVNKALVCIKGFSSSICLVLIIIHYAICYAICNCILENEELTN